MITSKQVGAPINTYFPLFYFKLFDTICFCIFFCSCKPVSATDYLYGITFPEPFFLLLTPVPLFFPTLYSLPRSTLALSSPHVPFSICTSSYNISPPLSPLPPFSPLTPPHKLEHIVCLLISSILRTPFGQRDGMSHFLGELIELVIFRV